MSAAGWLLLLGVVAVAVGGLVLAWPWIAMARQAHGDYHRARGTLHLTEIERALIPLHARLDQARTRAAQHAGELERVGAEERLALDRALAEHLVRTRLDEVPGIGGARVEAIRRGVFRGDLRDLLRADDVPGVGPQTAAAIAAWVQSTLAEWPRFLAGDFPGKTETADRYVARREELRREQEAATGRVAELEAIDAAARAELERLRRHTPGAFRRALRSGGAAAVGIQEYVLGVYPPWATAPAWYTALMEIDAGHRRG